MERKMHFRENWLIFWGEAELILRIWEAKGKYFQGAKNFLSVILGDQCFIFRDQGSTHPVGALFMGFLYTKG